jgi:NDP-sugar pyrophosphorylase family protein
VVSELQGAIIAAGSGERLRRNGEDIPKPLVRIDGETLLIRQARAMTRIGAREVVAIVNSETAGIITREQIALPDNLRLMVRDTPNSMESLLALGELLAPGNFLLATVDAIVTDAEFAKFIESARTLITNREARGFDGVLGVVRWRGDKRPLFAKVAVDRQIVALGDDESAPRRSRARGRAELGQAAIQLVTAGVYLLPTSIFAFAEHARGIQLSALRRFLSLLIDNGMRFGAVEMADVIDVDEAADLAAARVAAEVRR